MNTLLDISRLFIPIIAVIGIYIVWQQFITNREKVRLELYDKRFKIYDTLVNCLYDFLYGENFDNKDYVRFITACNEAEFLVPNRIYLHIDKAKKLIRSGRNIKNRLRTLEKHNLEFEKNRFFQGRNNGN